jgi:deazaflavin-dependent oxidoreductase (nitroreductase family)
VAWAAAPAGPPRPSGAIRPCSVSQLTSNHKASPGDGDSYLLVASKGGAPEAPDWYHNLKANPDVEINVGPRRFAVTTQPVLPNALTTRGLRQIVNKNNHNRYNEYQKRTSRPIPIVVLTPKGKNGKQPPTSAIIAAVLRLTSRLS